MRLCEKGLCGNETSSRCQLCVKCSLTPTLLYNNVQIIAILKFEEYYLKNQFLNFNNVVDKINYIK